MSNRGVKFYSPSDLSCGYNLELAGKILESYRDDFEYNINQILEFYNIQLFFNYKCYLTKWDDESIHYYLDISKKFNKKIGTFFSKINKINIKNIYKEVKNNYYNDFWTLFVKYKVYKRITAKEFINLLIERMDLHSILTHNALVIQYDEALTEIMNNKIESCEILLNEFLTSKQSDKKYYFPKSLDKEKFVTNYVDSNNANLNYLELIYNSLSTKEFPLSDKVRLKAKRKYEKGIKDLFNGENGFTYGVSLSFSDIQKAPVNIKFKKHDIVLTYSKSWFENNLEYPIILIYNFIHNFGIVDKQIRFSNVHKLNSMSTISKLLGIKGSKEYIVDISFEQLQMCEQAQMQSYYEFLLNNNIRLEQVCKWFFEEYMKTEFGVPGFYFNAPSQESSYLEKIRTLNSELDSILKQYRLWCEDKYIDLELLQISSRHIKYKDIPSLIDKKYIYSNSEEFNIASYLLCSDQSNILYISEDYSKYTKFHELINDNNLTVEDFHSYQYDDIKWLINHYYIYQNKNGFLKSDINIISIIDDLYFNDVLSYHHLDKSKQKMIDILLEKGLLKYCNKLFSKPESDYLNYIFNKSDFSNGLDLRNKYIHGTQTLDELIHKDDYYIILRMLVLCILKINDELCLEYEINNTFIVD